MKKLFIAALLFLPLASFAQVPDFPMAFWGDVTIDGAAAPVESVVRVYDETEALLGEVVVAEAGVYGYTAPTKQKLVAGEGGGALTFTIQAPDVRGGVETEGQTAITYPAFTLGETVELDLAFTTVPEVVQQPRRSGGSSRSRADETPAAEVLGVATTTEEQTEDALKIALQKQLIVLLTKLLALLQQQMAMDSL